MDTTNQQKPVWLITGCSTGFGRELAKQLLVKGYNVVITARDTGKVKTWRKGMKRIRWYFRLM